MNMHAAIASQYQAALSMLETTIRRCPADLWIDPQAKDQFWQLAYHALFFTHLYVQESEAAFQPWPKHRPDYEQLGPIRWDNNRLPQIGAPYTPEDVLEFLTFCRSEVEANLPRTDFAAPSGFAWLPFTKLELQIYTIRHVQQHTGELAARLSGRGIEIRWIGQGDG
jgi:hypothetical protein